MKLSRRSFLAATLASAAPPSRAWASDWATIAAEAKGQTVYFNAWAGSETINAYIAWAGEELSRLHGVTLNHVKITDTAEVVKRVRDEVSAGKQSGSVDLVWINGENFRTMKDEKLLFGPFAESLPNFALVDVDGKPTTRVDFAEPTDGFESPWGMAQFTFFGDGAKVGEPPASMMEFLALAKHNPGGLTYTAPPDFYGTTFLKQVLAETAPDTSAFAKPITAEGFAPFAAAMNAFLDELHPHLWREGKQLPPSEAQITQMVADGELLVGLTFNPNEPANLVMAGTMPQTTIAWQHAKGMIGNTHFVAIPVNAQAKAAAQLTANFLLSPEAQARKADLKVWGDPTVLAVSKLPAGEAALFSSGKVPGSVIRPAPAVPEPHASWVPLIEANWLSRYGKG
ncbi:MAG: ABC transporter substrate-binding protein [Proteobacteria bacterium]|nr:ABC transporter substrate-binding protein [Pseudomonadota bacterium]